MNAKKRENWNYVIGVWTGNIQLFASMAAVRSYGLGGALAASFLIYFAGRAAARWALGEPQDERSDKQGQ